MKTELKTTGDENGKEGSTVEPIYFAQGPVQATLKMHRIPLRLSGKEGEQGVHLFQLFVEEAVYILMVGSQLNLFQRTQASTEKKKVSIADIYQSLQDRQGYNCLQSVYFYFKVRKLSKWICRSPFADTQGPAQFDVSQKQNDQKTKRALVLVNCNQKVRELLKKLEWKQKEGIKLFITSSLDGVCLSIAEPSHFQSSEDD